VESISVQTISTFNGLPGPRRGDGWSGAGDRRSRRHPGSDLSHRRIGSAGRVEKRDVGGPV